MRTPDPIEILRRLVAWPTVSDRPVTALAAYMAEQAEQAGFRVRRYETSEDKCNVVAAIGPEGTDGLILSGHMDVVPTEGQDWSSDPFTLTEREGRLYARGSADMKGFLAATTAATLGMKLKDLRRELVLIWTHDEEVGCKGSHALCEQLEAEARPMPSMALIGEPTDFRVARMHPGHVTMRIRCLGRAAHSSRPDLGASAIKVATRVLLALEGLDEVLRTERAFEAELAAPYAVLNVAMIQGGAAVNIVPDAVDIRLGVRPLPGQAVSDLYARLIALAEEVDREVRPWGGGVVAEPQGGVPAMLTARGTPLETLLAPWAATAAPGAVPFATDGGNLARLGVSPLIFGPGSIDVAHRPDEYIETRDLVRATDIIGELIHRRCAVRADS